MTPDEFFGFPPELFERARTLGDRLNEPRFRSLREKCPAIIERWCTVQRERYDEDQAYTEAVHSRLEKVRVENPSKSFPDLLIFAEVDLLCGDDPRIPIRQQSEEPEIPLVFGQPIATDHVLLIVCGLHDFLRTRVEYIGPRPDSPSSTVAEDANGSKSDGWFFQDFAERALPRLTATNLEDLEKSLEQMASIIISLSSNDSSDETPVERDPVMEARDKWIYEQCRKRVEYSKIISKLGKKPATWPRIESPNGIKNAAKWYAKRHELPPIPKRQRGRIPRK